MIQEIDFSSVNDVIIDGNTMDVVNINSDNAWNRFEPTIFSVKRYTPKDLNSNGPNGSWIRLKVTAGDYDAQVEYGGAITTVPAGTTVQISYGTDGTTDDGTPASGNMTFSGDVAEISGATWTTGSKGTTYGYGCITGVVSWGSLRKIGQYLFSNAALINVDLTFSNRITEIGSWAFFNANVQTIKLPKHFVSLDTEVFSSTQINQFVFPEWLNKIPYGIFESCKQLKHIVIPKTVTGWKAGQGAAGTGTSFQNSGLESVEFELPCSLTSIASYTFAQTQLKEFIVPEGIKSLGVTCIYESKELSKVVLPQSLEKIDQQAFQSCSALTTITIPKNVKEIGLSAFKFCSGLTSVVFENPNGWTRNGVAIDFSDPTESASILTATYDDAFAFVRS